MVIKDNLEMSTHFHSTRTLRKIILLSFFCLSLIDSFPQASKIDFEIDSIVEPFEIIYSTPIRRIWLKKELIEDYQGFLLGSGKDKIDTSIFIEMIGNNIKADTIYWSDVNIKKAILVANKDEPINLQYVLNKFSFLKGRRKRKLVRKIKEYNNTDKGRIVLPGKRFANSYSRPIYDNSGHYAVVAYNYPREGYGISLYHLTNSRWILIGDIERWAY